MWPRFVLVVLLASSCTTHRGAKNGVAAGAGLVLGGGVWFAAGTLSGVEDFGPTAGQGVGVVIGSVGALILVASLISLIPIAMRESKASN